MPGFYDVYNNSNGPLTFAAFTLDRGYTKTVYLTDDEVYNLRGISVTRNTIADSAVSTNGKLVMRNADSTAPNGGGNRTFALLGDSVSAQGFGGSVAGGLILSVDGFGTWAAYLNRYGIELTHEGNFGISGQTSEQVLNRINAVLDYAPAVCTVLVGTNDIADFTAKQTIENLAKIYEILQDAGIIVIAIPILPRGLITTAQYGKILQINQWILRQKFARRKIYVADCTLAYGDPKTGTPRAAMTAVGDQLHPNGFGAYAIGNEVAKILTRLFPDSLVPFANALDVYSAADNPTGNLITTGTLIGTGGGLSNGPTGSLATGWSANGVNLPAGATVVFSKVTKSDGRDFQQIVFGGNYNAASPSSFNITAASAHANVQPGDVLEASCELEVDAGQTNLASIQLLIDVQTPSGNPTPIGFVGNNGSIMPNVAHSGIIKTPRVVIPATPTLVRATLRFIPKSVSGSSALSATVRFGSVSLRKVA